MNYSDCRNSIKSGDIIVLSHSKWGSFYDLQVQAVRLASLTEFSHIGVAVVLGGHVWLAESVMPFVRLVPLSNFAGQGFYVIHTDKEMTTQEFDFLVSKIGNGRYSKWQAIKAWFGKLKLGMDELYECAEYVILARRLSGLDLGNRAVPAAVVKEALLKGYSIKYIKD